LVPSLQSEDQHYQYSAVYWFLEHPLYTGLIAAALFELVTVIMRFGFKMSSPTHTRRMARFTGGYRIHHGYPGIGMFLAVPLIPSPTVIGSLVIIIAMMLLLSDLVHHAIVLPLCVGRHEFDVKYPSTPLNGDCDSGSVVSRIS
jgi:hypothetical protein